MTLEGGLGKNLPGALKTACPLDRMAPTSHRTARAELVEAPSFLEGFGQKGRASTGSAQTGEGAVRIWFSPGCPRKPRSEVKPLPQNTRKTVNFVNLAGRPGGLDLGAAPALGAPPWPLYAPLHTTKERARARTAGRPNHPGTRRHWPRPLRRHDAGRPRGRGGAAGAHRRVPLGPRPAGPLAPLGGPGPEAPGGGRPRAPAGGARGRADRGLAAGCRRAVGRGAGRAAPCQSEARLWPHDRLGAGRAMGADGRPRHRLHRAVGRAPRPGRGRPAAAAAGQLRRRLRRRRHDAGVRHGERVVGGAARRARARWWTRR